MSKSGKRKHLSQVLDGHVRSIQETFQMLEIPADSRLDKVDWSEVTKLGDAVSKQATVGDIIGKTSSRRLFRLLLEVPNEILGSLATLPAGMLWSGDAPDVEALEENIGAYCNMLHGFLLHCHASTVGAGPTLHANISASAKQVIDCSIALLRGAVISYESQNREKRLSIPQLSGAVWEACVTLKKTPTTNCTAVGRAITQVAVSIKDVLREMGELKELKLATSEDSGASSKASESTSVSDEEEEGELFAADIGSDLSAEEMAIAQLIISVVSDTLAVMKELIRYISGLLKSSRLKINTKESTDSLEKLLSYCQEMGFEVNELGASVYPPQEVCQMNSSAEEMYSLVEKMLIEVYSLEGSADGVFGTFKQLESSLRNLQHGRGDNIVNKMERLQV